MGELSMERFRGIFKLTYNGDAHIVLQTKVQVQKNNNNKKAKTCLWIDTYSSRAFSNLFVFCINLTHISFTYRPIP